jgi:hypothetical protein
VTKTCKNKEEANTLKKRWSEHLVRKKGNLTEKLQRQTVNVPENVVNVTGSLHDTLVSVLSSFSSLQADKPNTTKANEAENDKLTAQFRSEIKIPVKINSENENLNNILS